MNLLEGTWVEVRHGAEWCGHLCCTTTDDGRNWHEADCEPNPFYRPPFEQTLGRIRARRRQVSRCI